MKKEILDLLTPSTTLMRENDIVVHTVKNLLDNLGSMFPKLHGVTHSLSSQLLNEIGLLRRTSLNVNAYFTGNGPIADQIKRYTALERLIYGVNGFTGLSNILDTFNFNPTKDPETVNALNSFLSSARSLCDNAPITTLKTNIPDFIAPADMETGLYGNIENGNSFTLILRTHAKTEDEIEMIFLARPDTDAFLWYWHPFERAWINSDHEVTFDGALEQLDLQLKQAIIDATVFVEELDFKKEIKDIIDESCVIFNDEKYLDSSVICNETGYAPLPSGYYKYDSERSEIKISVRESQFILRNTKGTYPSLSGSLVSVVNGVSSTIEISKVDEKFQRQLITKTKHLFKILLRDIENNKIKEVTNEDMH